MIGWFEKFFLTPFIIGLSYDWFKKTELSSGDIFFIRSYVIKSFSVFPLFFKFVFYTLGLFFLIFCPLLFCKSFSCLKPYKASLYIQKWRQSSIPGCSEFIQVFENLIALSMFAGVGDRNGA